ECGEKAPSQNGNPADSNRSAGDFPSGECRQSPSRLSDGEVWEEWATFRHGDRSASSAANFVISAGFIPIEPDQAVLLEILQQVRKPVVAVVAFIETGVNAADRLFEHRSPDHVVVLLDRVK